MADDEAAKKTSQSEPDLEAVPGPQDVGKPAASLVDDSKEEITGEWCHEDEQDDQPDAFADTQPPSAKLEHDYLPGPITGDDADGRTQPPFTASSMVPCAGCATALEPWQLACHQCGRIACSDMVPPVVAESSDRAAVMASFSDWLKGGIAACDAGRYNEAQNCFNEALARVKGIDDAARREVEVRKQLAIALERQEKRAEASAQYVALANLARPSKDDFEKRARELSMSTTDVLARINTGIVYRAPEGKESRLVPLYCSHCRQLLVEAEVHGFRNGRASTVRCFCGADGPPLVRVDEKHFRALKNAPVLRSQRAALLQCAAQGMPEGRTRGMAAAYALLLGWCGAHRFYLGERAYGAVYLLWWLAPWLVYVFNVGHSLTNVMLLWSCVPWLVAVFEAINYVQMSRVTFNLTYNIEDVLNRLPPNENVPVARGDLFTMESGAETTDEDDDDLIGVSSPAFDGKSRSTGRL